MKKRIKFMQYRRKKEGLTNYRKRLTLLMSGTPRIVIRKSNKNMLVQVVSYSEDGDKVSVTATSNDLKKLGWKKATGNMPAAYLTGYLAGKKSLQKKVSKAIVDFGLQTTSHGSRLYAAVKGAIDAGMDISCSPEVFPPEDRIKGKHIASHLKSDIDKEFDAMMAKLK